MENSNKTTRRPKASERNQDAEGVLGLINRLIK